MTVYELIVKTQNNFILYNYLPNMKMRTPRTLLSSDSTAREVILGREYLEREVDEFRFKNGILEIAAQL